MDCQTMLYTWFGVPNIQGTPLKVSDYIVSEFTYRLALFRGVSVKKINLVSTALKVA